MIEYEADASMHAFVRIETARQEGFQQSFHMICRSAARAADGVSRALDFSRHDARDAEMFTMTRFWQPRRPHRRRWPRVGEMRPPAMYRN